MVSKMNIGFYSNEVWLGNGDDTKMVHDYII
ncbi:MAG: hypothetical protein JWM30_4253 [Burkholderia sp.]|nr:hypothetical protein [Burkholderia sp.]